MKKVIHYCDICGAQDKPHTLAHVTIVCGAAGAGPDGAGDEWEEVCWKCRDSIVRHVERLKAQGHPKKRGTK